MFDDFEEIKEHPDYEESHLKGYYDRFYKNYAATMERRSHNLKQLNQGIDKLYSSISENLENGKFKDAFNNSLELFYFDNSSMDKYMYLLLAKLKAKSSVELYDSLAKQRKKEKESILNSVIFEKLFSSEKYQPLIKDLILHCRYKKRKRIDRILIEIRGEEDGV